MKSVCSFLSLLTIIRRGCGKYYFLAQVCKLQQKKFLQDWTWSRITFFTRSKLTFLSRMLFSKILRHGHDSLVSPGSQVGRDGSGDHTRIRILRWFRNCWEKCKNFLTKKLQAKEVCKIGVCTLPYYWVWIGNQEEVSQGLPRGAPCRVPGIRRTQRTHSESTFGWSRTQPTWVKNISGFPSRVGSWLYPQTLD